MPEKIGSSARAPAQEATGDDARYVFERRLGAGGAGTVHLVSDRETGERFALKKLFRMDAKSVLRLKREFRSLTDINHPNIIKLYELGRASDAWFLTMEYLDGSELHSYLAANDQIGAPDATSHPSAAYGERLIPAFHQLACGIQALHRAGMLHRDLKPSNVLVADHRVVVLDFGLVRDLADTSSKVTEEGSVSGTPAYMAPEQARGAELSAASDWYAFGVMLYEAVSGVLPCDGPLLELFKQKLERDPTPLDSLVPGLPPHLNELCMALLRRDPLQRPKGAEILAALEPLRKQAAAVQLLPATEPTLSATGETTFRTATQAQVALPTLFGRESELATLRRAMAQVEDGALVIVHVRGESGAGKSALVESFLEEIDRQGSTLGAPDALTLRSRCYEREAMPFKALDGVLDALVRHLSQLDDFDVAHLLPAEVITLVQLFPVLERLRAVQRLLATAKPRGDAVQERQRAELALRELFGRLAKRKPLAIWIDDLQWGDLDSAAIIRDWLQQPSHAPMLLILSYRSDEVSTSPCLRVLLGNDATRTAAHAIEHTLPIEALPGDEIHALCTQRLGQHAAAHPELLHRIIRESQGSPFLATQLTALAEAKLARGDGDVDALSLDELVAQTSALLPVEAAQVLQVLAVAGRPMQPKLVLRAAGVKRDSRAILHALRGLNLVRTRDAGGERLLEVYHNRVRERVQSALSADERRRIHDCLLRALEFSGQADPDWLHALALGAEQDPLALRYGLAAAERANATLAFVRATELYQKCLELSDSADAIRGELWLKLAAAQACCGRGVKAAEAYLEAAKHCAAKDVVTLMRLAASHLLRSGRFEEGDALVRKVLTAMDLSVPETSNGLVAAIVWERSRLQLRGMSYVERAEQDVPASFLAQIDLFDALSVETQATDAVRAALFQARALRWALEAGEPTRVVSALCAASNIAAVAGTPRAARRADELLNRAEALARKIGSEREYGRVCGARALRAFLCGLPHEVLEPSYEAERILLAEQDRHSRDTYFRRFGIVGFRIGALALLGELQRFLLELKTLSHDARATENGHAPLALTLNETLAEEILGESANSRERLEAQRPQLPNGRFGLLHMLNMVAIMRTVGATGEFAWAEPLLQSDWQRYTSSGVRGTAVLACMVHVAQLRLLINRHVTERRQGDLRALVRADLRALTKLKLPWCEPAISRAEARLAYLEGDQDTALQRLRESADGYERSGSIDEATRDRFALGLLIGGDEGTALRTTHERLLRERGVHDPSSNMRGYFPELFGA